MGWGAGPVCRLLTAAFFAIVGICGCASGDAPATADSNSAALAGTSWLAEDIGGGGVIDRLQTTLSFLGNGRVAGSGGCNRYTGPVELTGETIRFGMLAATQMACTPAAMHQEQRFFAALAAVVRWQQSSLEHKLILYDAGNTPLLKFSRLSQEKNG